VAWRKPWLVLTTLAIAGASAIVMAAQIHAAERKQFSDFPAKETFSGKISAPDAKTAPKQWSAVRKIFKDIIRQEMAKGANFAGDYYLATVGCGSSCEAIFVIDVHDGRVFAAPDSATNGVFFQKDSRLIIIRENKDYNLSRTYLVFEKGRFIRLAGPETGKDG